VSVERRHVLGLLSGGLVAGVLARPAPADTALDVRILQTASSLEALAVAAYARVTEEYAAAAGRRHADHKQAFQRQTAALGGRVQDAPNPRFQSALAGADPVAAAATIEKVTVDTYLGNLSMLQDGAAKELVAAAMAVAAQHLAVLRVAGANPGLFRIPFRAADLAKLPSTAATVATPDAFHQAGGPESIADPASGAVA
jgi:hypothetical protein